MTVLPYLAHTDMRVPHTPLLCPLQEPSSRRASVTTSDCDTTLAHHATPTEPAPSSRKATLQPTPSPMSHHAPQPTPLSQSPPDHHHQQQQGVPLMVAHPAAPGARGSRGLPAPAGMLPPLDMSSRRGSLTETSGSSCEYGYALPPVISPVISPDHLHCAIPHDRPSPDAPGPKQPHHSALMHQHHESQGQQGQGVAPVMGYPVAMGVAMGYACMARSVEEDEDEVEPGYEALSKLQALLAVAEQALLEEGQ